MVGRGDEERGGARKGLRKLGRRKGLRRINL